MTVTSTDADCARWVRTFIRGRGCEWSAEAVNLPGFPRRCQRGATTVVAPFGAWLTLCDEHAEPWGDDVLRPGPGEGDV